MLRAAPRARHLLKLTVFTTIVLLLVAYVVAPGVFIWSYTHQARAAMASNPSNFGLAYENVRFPSQRDGIALSGWFIPSSSSGRAIIFVHGIGANRWAEPGYAASAVALHQHGYGVLTFDLRAEGESGGSQITMGAREQYDVLGAVAYLKKRLGTSTKIGLLSYSMGAATALLAAADDQADITAVVSDSAYGNLNETIQADIAAAVHPLDGPLSWTLEHEAPLLIGVDPSTIQPVQAVATMKHTPVLYIAGTSDKLIPHSQSQMLYTQAGDHRSQLWLVPGAGHVGAYFAQPQRYEQRMLDFFQAYV